MHKYTALWIGNKALELESIFKYHEIWPGWKLGNTPFSLYKSNEWALLWLHPEILSGFNWIVDSKTVQCLDKNCSWRGNTLISLQSSHCGIVDTNHTSPELAIPFLCHEVFHAFQQTWIQNRWHDFTLWSKYPENNIENMSLCKVENQILLQPGFTVRDLVNFVSLRNYRLSKLPPEIADFEQKGFLVEGTASYIEKRVLCLLQSIFDSVYFEIPEKMSKQKVEQYLQETSLQHSTTNIAFRWYGVGYRVGIILDRFMPSWKKSLMNSTQLWEEFLTASLPGTNHIAELLHQYKYEDITEATEKEQQEKENDICKRIKSIQTASEGKLTVNFEKRKPSGFVFSPSDMTNVSESIKLHTSLFGLQFSDPYKIDIQKRDVIEYVHEKSFECILPNNCKIQKMPKEVVLQGSDFSIHVPYLSFQEKNGNYFIKIDSKGE